MSRDRIQRIRHEARLFFDAEGEGRTVCPVCMGGNTKEASLAVFIGDDNRLRAMCHRATCPTRGMTTMVRTSRYYGRDKQKERSNVSKMIPIINIGHDHAEKIKDKYAFPYTTEILTAYVAMGHDAYKFPMYDVDGRVRGEVVRPWNPGTGPKSLSYRDEKDYSGLSWYRPPHFLGLSDVYLVEDCMSAIALRQMGLAAVSLNGTLLNSNRINELLRYKWRVILMLDADATRTAIRHRLTFGPDVIKVVRLVKDIKDMTLEEVQALLEQEV